MQSRAARRAASGLHAAREAARVRRWPEDDFPARRARAYGPGVRFRVLGPLEVSGRTARSPSAGPSSGSCSRTCSSGRTRSSLPTPDRRRLGRGAARRPPERPSRATSRASAAPSGRTIEGARPATSCAPTPTSWTDAVRDAAAEAARRRHPERGHDVLGEALGLWRGPAFADSWRAVARRRDRAARGAAPPGARGADRGRARARASRRGRRRARGADGRDPLRERLWGQLMLALYRSGPAGRRARRVRSRAGAAGRRARRSIRRRNSRSSTSGSCGRTRPRAPRASRSAATGCSNRIGEGAFGVVYRAIQPQVGREVAIKVDPPGAREPARLRPAVRARGAARRAPRASAHRPAVRLLARAGRCVPRDAVPPRRQPRGRCSRGTARARTRRGDPRPGRGRRCRPRTDRGSCTAT